jgi:CDP-diacylglycerol--glycerol-3-phosphate 3-phosphatidyltransferase
VIKARFGADTDRMVRRLLPFLSRWRIKPDLLTALGVALSALAGVAFGLDRPLAAGLALGAAGFFDLVDGVVARSQGTSSAAGAFLDSSMDRLSDLLVFGGLAYLMAARGDGPGVLLVMWALTGAVMTSYTRARAETKLAKLEVGWMERGERLGFLVLGGLTGWIEIALWIVAIGATVTSVQRIVVARRLLRAAEDAPQARGAAAHPAVED